MKIVTTDHVFQSLLPGLGGVMLSLDTLVKLSGVTGLGTFFTLAGSVLFATLLRLRTGVGTVLELLFGVALPRLLGVSGTSGFFTLVGVCALLTGCPVEILFLLLVAVLGLTGVVNDFDRCILLGVEGLLTPCSVEVPLDRRPGVLLNTLLDLRGSLGVRGAFLIIPGGASALIGWGRPLGLVNVGFDNALVPFTGFKLALVIGTLRGQTFGIDWISEAEPFEMTKVSFRSFD